MSSESAAHVGETTSVRGTIAQISTMDSGMIFVNFGQPHPNSELTAVVRAGTSGFEHLADLEGKEVIVDGEIELHKDRPQIVLNNPEQIRLADGSAMPTDSAADASDAPSPPPSDPTPSADKTIDDTDSSEQSVTVENFKVPLNDEEKRLAKRSPSGTKPNEASVSLMLPAGFDPSEPQNVLVVFSTDDNGGDHIKAMPRFGGIAARQGWVAIAATGPVLDNNLTPEWHAAMIYAGLRALVEKFPKAKSWRFFTGGNSGGGLRSSMMSCALLKKGYPVEGVFMGGSGDERFTAGMAIFRPDRSKVRDLAVYLAIGKNDPMINSSRADYVADAVKKLGIKNVRRDSYDGAHGMNEESFTKALNWFE